MRMTQEMKDERKAARQALRKAHIDALNENTERSQNPIQSLTITIEWHKSYMWGSNPKATAQVEYKQPQPPYNGTFERRNGYTCSGCGYDKESTVIAQVFNDFLKYKLYGALPTDKKYWLNGAETNKPYGLSLGEYKYYSGGIGTSCYDKISDFIGGKFEHIASGKMLDVYKYTDNELVDLNK